MAAAGAFAFLTFVAVSKTLLTKLVFTSHDNGPVAFSVLSCVLTLLCMWPVFKWKPETWAVPRPEMYKGFLGVCVAIALDLACTNVALSLLSVALQQCIKATSPALTIMLESAVNKKLQHPLIYVTIALICLGPILAQLGTTSFDSTPLGIFMMLFAVTAGAFKYVAAHAVIKEYRGEMGTLAFTFWVEVVVAIMLLPWAILNGELSHMISLTSLNTNTVLLWFTAAYGGVRIYSQFLLLAYTSATTLAMSNLAIQAFTIILGIFFFGTELTSYLVWGVTVTLVFSAVYTYLKLSKVLEKTEYGKVGSGGH